MTAALHCRLSTFTASLHQMSAQARYDAMVNECIENGGTFIPPQGDNWSSHLWEISLHGVCARAETAEEAIRNWSRAAQRILAAPRNHAEEIAAARAEIEAAQ